MAFDFGNANEAQRSAISTTDGPLLIIAGPGTGKTYTLVKRIVYLITEKDVLPEEIMIATFTEKAAKELITRITNELYAIGVSVNLNEMYIGTFHSICLRILKDHLEYTRIKKNYRMLDNFDQQYMVFQKINRFRNLPYFDVIFDKKQGAWRQAGEIVKYVNNLAEELVDIDEMQGDADEHIVAVANIMKQYNTLMEDENLIDFSSIQTEAYKLLIEKPSILEEIQQKIKYVMVDEYQDTNEAQYTFSRLLSSKYRNIFVVGDNDQAIYAFRGANYKNILNFEKDYPEAKTILLEENYRSTKNILNAANSVIKNNRERKDKNLWSNNEEGDKIKYKKVSTEKEEASFVVGEIKDLISKGVKEEDIAVLYRTNAQSRTIEEELLKKNIKYRVVGSFYFYNRKEIKDLLCYLRLINNHKDDVSLLRIINTPKRGIGEKTIDNLTTLAEDADISIYEAITTGKELTFKELIEELTKDSEKMSLTELVDDILDKSGIRKELESSKLLEDEIRLENLNEFKGVTKSYEEEFGSASLEDFLEEISLVSDITEHQDSDGRVSLMTVHSVKGLEFDYVFIVGMEEGIFPHYNAINDGSNSAIEEERRLCYVAITRAKKKLYITSADTRMLFGNTNRNMPSRFINEIDKEYIEVEGIKPLTKMVSNIKKKIDKNAEYTVGEHIVHTEFGEGVVIGVDKSILTVAFPHPTGIRKLMKGHPNIKKI